VLVAIKFFVHNITAKSAPCERGCELDVAYDERKQDVDVDGGNEENVFSTWCDLVIWGAS